MSHSVARLHCRFRVAGPNPGALAARLDGLLRLQCVTALSQSLERAFGQDPAVYVVRALSVQVALDTGAREEAGNRWGRAVLAALRGAVNAEDSGNLARFEDQAHYAAQFLADLLDGKAWERWYYLAFQKWRGQPDPLIVRQVLEAWRDWLAAILARLHRSGHLARLLALLDTDTRRALWLSGMGGPEIARDRLRPLLAVAKTVIEDLGLGTGIKPDTELWLNLCLTPALPPVDWSSPDGPARAVYHILERLATAGRRAPMNDTAMARLQQQRARLSADQNWLDMELLFHLLALEAERLVPARQEGARTPPENTPAPDPETAGRTDGGTSLPPMHAKGLTPRLHNKLTMLGQALSRIRHLPPRIAPDPAAVALRWYAALPEEGRRWAEDEQVRELIDHILALVIELEQAGLAPDREARILAGEHSASFNRVNLLGEAGRVLIRRLRALCAGVRTVPSLAPDETPFGMESDNAGAWLMIRAFMDARLHAICAKTAYPSPGFQDRFAPLLTALLHRLGGASPAHPADPALSLLYATGEPVDHDLLGRAFAGNDPATESRFQRQLFFQAAGLRLSSGKALHFHRVPYGNGQAVFCGDGSGFWPLAQPLTPDTRLGVLLREWQTLWEQALGRAPRVIIEGHPGDRDKLLAGLAALPPGCPDRPHTDLTLTVAALVLLRIWARWLRKFETSSPAWLLEHLVRRRGTVLPEQNQVIIRLDQGPMDVLLDLAGYLRPLQTDWWGRRKIIFQWRGEPC